MGFVKYSKAKLDLVGKEMPEWVEDEEESTKEKEKDQESKKDD